jgi:hypothetical protein
MDTSGEPYMDSDRILLIIRSSVSLLVLFKVGVQGMESNLSAMQTRAHHMYSLDVLRHQMISMVVDNFAVLVLTLTWWAESSN